MSEDGFFSRKGQRKVSSFVGQELLYDYMTGELDEERKKSVEEFIQTSREAQAEIQKIQHGLNYVEKLAETKLSETLAEKIKMPTSYMHSVMQRMRFEDWPSSMKLAMEAAVVALGIVILIVVIPWHRLMDLKLGSTNVVLSEVSRPIAETAPSVESDTAKEDVSFPDEGEAATSPTVTSTTVPHKVAAVAIATTTTTLPRKEEPTEEEGSASTLVEAGESKRQGYLYRGTISVTNVSAVTPKLVEKISALGGRKAGEVEMGWAKGSDSYFHFTMPESHYEDLLSLFAEYGKLKIQKERHERVMPEGIIRVIITVNEKK